MKKSILVLIIAGIAFGFYSCTDIQGDGIDTIVYNGSTVPEDSAYCNPVWNFDLTDASVFLSSGPYYGMGSEKAWADGNSICCSHPYLCQPDGLVTDLTSPGLFGKTGLG